MSIGFPEILLLLAIALLFFGPSRLPGLGKSLGEAIRGFKKGIEGVNESLNDKSDAAPSDSAGENVEKNDDVSNLRQRKTSDREKERV